MPTKEYRVDVRMEVVGAVSRKGARYRLALACIGAAKLLLRSKIRLRTGEADGRSVAEVLEHVGLCEGCGEPAELTPNHGHQLCFFCIKSGHMPRHRGPDHLEVDRFHDDGNPNHEPRHEATQQQASLHYVRGLREPCQRCPQPAVCVVHARPLCREHGAEEEARPLPTPVHEFGPSPIAKLFHRLAAR